MSKNSEKPIYEHLCHLSLEDEKNNESGFSCKYCWKKPLILFEKPVPNEFGHICGRTSGSAPHCFGCAQIDGKNYVLYKTLLLEYNKNEKETIIKYCLNQRNINTIKIINEIVSCKKTNEEMIKEHNITTEIITDIRKKFK